LSFQIGSSSTFAAEGLGVKVDISGVQLDNPFFPAPAPQAVSQWAPARPPENPVRFRATMPTTTLRFTGAVFPPQFKGSEYIGIDNVSLHKVCFIVIAILYGCP
jgi:hypothetical protein